MIKVSVILPIYNVAPYLDETFKSLIGQTLEEIEIIAVNDGSTDCGEEIILKYQQQDPRIKYISQENQGLSVARNIAIQNANGEFIYMMDSDDLLSCSNALQLCYEYAKKNKADFIFFDGERVSEDLSKHLSSIKRTYFLNENTKYCGEDLLYIMLEKKIHNSAVWLLFINHEYIRKTELNFYPHIIHEDELYTTTLTLKSDNIYCFKKSLVIHRIRSTSIMGKKYKKQNINCYLIVFDELFKILESPIIKKFARYTLSRVFYTGHIIPLKDKLPVFWRAIKSGYLKYIGIKSALVFWLK